MTTELVDPFDWQTAEIVYETTVINDIASFLFSTEFQKGGYDRKRVRELVRSAIKTHRGKKSLWQPVSRSPNVISVQNFLAFACSRWPELKSVIPSHGATVIFEAPDALQAQFQGPKTLTIYPPRSYDELLAEYHKVLETMRDETTRRKAAEVQLLKYKLADVKRRKDGAKRFS